MSTLVTTNVWDKIATAASNTKHPSQVAVAYFGSRGPTLLPLLKGSALVVDASIPTVAQGATSPAALDQVRKTGVDIYTAQYLHAKVFAFDSVAFVGSANASQNSETKLIEAVLRVQSKTEIAAIRGFVESLCITKLSASDLIDLKTYYQPPKFPKSEPKQQQTYSTLLMELTNEQGGGRESQVQPPKGVWETFFGLHHPAIKLPTLTLVNEKVIPNQKIERKVVKHHHTYTIEIADAVMPRPAILQMRKIGPLKYTYIVHRPGEGKFAQVQRLIKTIHNPFWDSGRLWVLM